MRRPGTPRTRPEGRVFAVCDRSGGYTVVELVIVILLLGILAANAMPRFFEASRFEEMGYADAAIATARYAQKLALGSGCDTAFRIGPSGYGIYQRASSCNSGGFTRTVSRPGGGPWTAAVPGGVTVTTQSVYFDAQGRPSDLNSGSLLTAPATFTVGGRGVTIEAESGFVHMP